MIKIDEIQKVIESLPKEEYLHLRKWFSERDGEKLDNQEVSKFIPASVSGEMNHEALLAEYKNALSTQRWEVVAPLIHEKACFVFTEGTYVGKAAIEAAVRATFDLIKNENYSIVNLVWVHVSDTYAICTYDFTWSGLISGKQAAGRGRGTTVIVFDQGKWQIIHEHLGPSAI
jgi:ketosteroid isomerase-like protein